MCGQTHKKVKTNKRKNLLKRSKIFYIWKRTGLPMWHKQYFMIEIIVTLHHLRLPKKRGKDNEAKYIRYPSNPISTKTDFITVFAISHLAYFEGLALIDPIRLEKIETSLLILAGIIRKVLYGAGI